MLTGFRILSMSASFQFVYPNLFHMCFHVDRIPHFVHVSIIPISIYIYIYIPVCIPVCCTIFSCEHFHVNMIPHVFRVNTIPTRISQSVLNLFPCQKDSMCFYVIPISISLSVAQSFHVSMIAHVLHVNQTIPHLYL